MLDPCASRNSRGTGPNDRSPTPTSSRGWSTSSCTEQSRSEGATYLLLCHPNLHLLQPICLPDDPRRVGVGEVLEGVRLLLTEVSRHDVHDVVMVIARPGRVTPTPRDRDLRAAFEGACRETGLTLHAVAIAALDDVAVLPR